MNIQSAIAPRPPFGFFTFVLLGTMVAVTCNVVGLEFAYQGLVSAITGLVAAVALLLARQTGSSYGFGILLVTLPCFLSLSLLINGFISGNHLYLVFLIAFVAATTLSGGTVIERLLRATNFSYLFYLIGSLLVYFGVLDLGRALNIFDSQDRVPWIHIKTLVGLFGSTAHIDSISLFIALLNLTTGKGRSRWAFVALGFVASGLSFRFTPFVALAIAWLVTGLLRWTRASPALGRLFASVAALVIALSAFLAVGLHRTVDADWLTYSLNRLTNGRLRIWDEMLNVYANDATTLEQLFGTADTETLYVVGGWPRVHPQTREVEVFSTANPHNSYLAFALSFGLIPFIFLLAVMAAWARMFFVAPASLLFFYILAIGITNAELFTFQFPVYLAWVVVLGKRHDVPLPKPEGWQATALDITPARA